MSSHRTPRFGSPPPGVPATISGTVFDDLNGDGGQTAGEFGQPNWTVFLDPNNNRRLDSGEPFARSDPDGHYTFANGAPGPYAVAEVLQAGWALGSPARTVMFSLKDPS